MARVAQPFSCEIETRRNLISKELSWPKIVALFFGLSFLLFFPNWFSEGDKNSSSTESKNCNISSKAIKDFLKKKKCRQNLRAPKDKKINEKPHFFSTTMQMHCRKNASIGLDTLKKCFVEAKTSCFVAYKACPLRMKRSADSCSITIAFSWMLIWEDCRKIFISSFLRF